MMMVMTMMIIIIMILIMMMMMIRLAHRIVYISSSTKTSEHMCTAPYNYTAFTKASMLCTRTSCTQVATPTAITSALLFSIASCSAISLGET